MQEDYSSSAFSQQYRPILSLAFKRKNILHLLQEPGLQFPCDVSLAYRALAEKTDQLRSAAFHKRGYSLLPNVSFWRFSYKWATVITVLWEATFAIWPRFTNCQNNFSKRGNSHKSHSSHIHPRKECPSACGFLYSAHGCLRSDQPRPTKLSV